MKKLSLEDKQYILDNVYIMDDNNIAIELGIAKNTLYKNIENDEAFQDEVYKKKRERRSAMFHAKYRKGLDGDMKAISSYTHNNKLSKANRENLTEKDFEDHTKIFNLLINSLFSDDNLSRKDAMHLAGLLKPGNELTNNLDETVIDYLKNLSNNKIKEIDTHIDDEISKVKNQIDNYGNEP